MTDEPKRPFATGPFVNASKAPLMETTLGDVRDQNLRAEIAEAARLEKAGDKNAHLTASLNATIG